MIRTNSTSRVTVTMTADSLAIDSERWQYPESEDSECQPRPAESHSGTDTERSEHEEDYSDCVEDYLDSDGHTARTLPSLATADIGHAAADQCHASLTTRSGHCRCLTGGRQHSTDRGPTHREDRNTADHRYHGGCLKLDGLSK
jgi:hypothetical protein